MAQKAHRSQPAAPTVPHEPYSVQLHHASAALSDAPARSLDSLQSASGCPPNQPMQPSEQSSAAVFGLQHSDEIGGQSQVEARQNGSQHETEADRNRDLQRLEQEFVHDVYNAIAPHFSATRFAIWPKVLDECGAPLIFSSESQPHRPDVHGTATTACRLDRHCLHCYT